MLLPKDHEPVGPFQTVSDFNGRFVTVSKYHVQVSYRRGLWSKGAAWGHLQRNIPKEVATVAPRVKDNPKATNPWEKDHGDEGWTWIALRKLEDASEGKELEASKQTT